MSDVDSIREGANDTCSTELPAEVVHNMRAVLSQDDISKARRTAMLRVITKEFERHYEEHLSTYLRASSPDSSLEYLAREFDSTRQVKKCKFFGITINPYPEFDKFKCDAKIRSLDEIPDIDYVITKTETRSDDGSCSGIHYHVALQFLTEKYISQVKQLIVKKFRKFVGNKLHIKITAIKDETYKDNFLKYLQRTDKHSDDSLVN